MARSKPDGRTARLRREASGQDELFEESQTAEREARRAEPVERLGLTFENDEARRSHFLGRLRQGLEELHDKLGSVPYAGIDDAAARMATVEHWPMGDATQLRGLAERMRHADASKDLLQRWKDEVGFPDGEIEAIVNLSDPPWHTACPNPFLGEFVEARSKPYDPDEPYRRKPFAVDVSEGKTHPVYRAHGDHTKVPHLAIVPSILHYTEPGDLVLDGFARTGMTGVPAQWCGTAPESYRKELENRGGPGRASASRAGAFGARSRTTSRRSPASSPPTTACPSTSKGSPRPAACYSARSRRSSAGCRRRANERDTGPPPSARRSLRRRPSRRGSRLALAASHRYRRHPAWVRSHPPG